MGMRPRPAVQRKMAHSSPDSLLDASSSSARAQGLQSIGSSHSPYSSMADLEEIGAMVPALGSAQLDDICDIWDNVWYVRAAGSLVAWLAGHPCLNTKCWCICRFGLSCKSPDGGSAIKRWQSVTRDPLESVLVPDALAVNSCRVESLGLGAAPRLPEQQPGSRFLRLQQQEQFGSQLPGMQAAAVAGDTSPSWRSHLQPLAQAGETASQGAEPQLLDDNLWAQHAAMEQSGLSKPSQQLQQQQQQDRPSSPYSIKQQQQQQQEGYHQTSDSAENGLGTWTKRQYLLLTMPADCSSNSSPPLAAARNQGKAAAAAAAAAGGVPLGTSFAQPIPGTAAAVAAAIGDPGAQLAPGEEEAVIRRTSTEEEEAVTAAAWRWRMARRWHTEQQRALDGHEGASMTSDHLDEALQYLNACTVNWQQLGRTGSTEQHLSGTAETNKLLGTLGSSFLGHDLLGSEDGGRSRSMVGGMLSREASFHGIGAPQTGGHGHAIQEVNKITKAARELMKAQGDIDKAVKER